jgi:hypothetical protein
MPVGRNCCPIVDNFRKIIVGFERREEAETARIELISLHRGLISGCTKGRLYV